MYGNGKFSCRSRGYVLKTKLFPLWAKTEVLIYGEFSNRETIVDFCNIQLLPVDFDASQLIT
jgi:hypothetical protein